MIEVAGSIISGISLIKDLYTIHKDLGSWKERDLEVDRDWLPLALKHNLLTGTEADYRWVALRRVPTLELEGTYQVAVAHNDDKKVLSRIVYGHLNNRSVLMRRTSET